MRGDSLFCGPIEGLSSYRAVSTSPAWTVLEPSEPTATQAVEGQAMASREAVSAETFAVSAASHLVPLKFSAPAPTAQQSRVDAQATDCIPPPRRLVPVATFQ